MIVARDMENGYSLNSFFAAARVVALRRAVGHMIDAGKGGLGLLGGDKA